MVLAAAGEGRRLGAGPPKQHVLLAGRPLLLHSLRALEVCPEVASIVVVVEEGGFEDWRALLLGPLHAKVLDVVVGGRTRAHSVRNGLHRLAEASSVALVAVHDGARPFVSRDLVRSLLERVTSAPPLDGVCPALPLQDTVKEVDEAGIIFSVLDRSRLLAVQTPQVFWREALVRAYERPDEALQQATDDAFLVESSGGRVGTVHGQWSNFKITTPFDLHVAELLLAEKDGGRAGSVDE